MLSGIFAHPWIFAQQPEHRFYDLIVEDVWAEFVVRTDQLASCSALDFLAGRKVDATADAGGFLLYGNVAPVQSTADEVVGGRGEHSGEQIVKIRAQVRIDGNKLRSAEPVVPGISEQVIEICDGYARCHQAGLLVSVLRNCCSRLGSSIQYSSNSGMISYLTIERNHLLKSVTLAVGVKKLCPTR